MANVSLYFVTLTYLIFDIQPGGLFAFETHGVDLNGLVGGVMAQRNGQKNGLGD